jgi:hypothetical protein
VSHPTVGDAIVALSYDRISGHVCREKEISAIAASWCPASHATRYLKESSQGFADPHLHFSSHLAVRSLPNQRKLLAPCSQLSTSNMTEPVPISYAASQYFDGNDGKWSSFVVRAGTPEQSFRVLPSTVTTEILLPLAGACKDNETISKVRHGATEDLADADSCA